MKMIKLNRVKFVYVVLAHVASIRIFDQEGKYAIEYTLSGGGYSEEKFDSFDSVDVEMFKSRLYALREFFDFNELGREYEDKL